jgi:RNA polymerase sigma-70 factor, ECF subfamily
MMSHDVREGAIRDEDRIDGPREGSPGASLSHLEGYRRYLLVIANEMMGAGLRAKVGASDVVQEALLEAYEHLPAFRGTTPVEVRAWLREILRCRLANVRRFYRRSRRSVEREVPLDQVAAPGHRECGSLAGQEPSPSHHAIRAELTDALEAAIDRLPAHYQEAIVLRQRCGLSFREVGERIGCTEEAARKLWGRGILMLRRELGEWS